MGTKRTYKDSLFRSIFKDKKRLSRLYKALSGNEISPKDITINTLKGVFMNDVKNDISFLVGNRLVILLEHQSTWNPNMPLRFLWYLSKLYRLYVNKDMIYHTELLKIPTPEFYVLYNGTMDIPSIQELRLSDAFEIPGNAMELTAKCYNINYKKDREVLDACYELKAYSTFIAIVRDCQKKGLSLFQSIKEAIAYCETHDLMGEYFRIHESEVYDMVSFKWDEKRAREIAAEEAKKAGREEGRAEGTKSAFRQAALSLMRNKVPLKIIMSSTNMTADEVKKLAKENGLTFE
ncbi:hypothetical protein [uncultured Dialister sp.]|uniref:hypothetical protein n=1 Tax=uncultured Dialister sp. TaxID=278064 RepID=UPI0026DB753E|nr:hypothetical protein [uncultured Dialister sp.]